MKLKNGLIIALLSVCLTSFMVACGETPEFSECEKIGTHDFSILISEDYPATCVSEGSALMGCSRCDAMEKIHTPATGIHSEEIVQGYDATCTTNGKTDKAYCSVCNETLVESQTIEKGHTVGELAYISLPNADYNYDGYVQFYCGRNCSGWGGYKQYYTTTQYPNGEIPLPKLTDPAYEIEVVGEDTNYTIDIFGKTVQFTLSNFEYGRQMVGNTYVYSVFSYKGNSTNLVIPETYNGGPVVEILENAFKGNTSIENVTIPSSVTKIGDSAFEGCTSLKTINVPEGVTTISNNAFKDCTSLTTISLPSTLRIIQEKAFANCYNLENFNLPSSVTTIFEYAFENCAKIKELEFSLGGVVYQYAFRNCTALEKVTIPAHLSGRGVLKGCNSLKTLTLGDIRFDLLSLFHNTDSYTASHTIPASLKELIIDGLYSEEEGLANETYNDYNVLSNIEKVTVLNTKIIYGGFNDFTSLTTISIPSEVTYLGANTFSNCPNLTTNVSNYGKYVGNETNHYVALIDYVEPDTQSDFTLNENANVISTPSQFWDAFTSYNIHGNVTYISTNSNSYAPTSLVYYDGTPSKWLSIETNAINLLKNGTVTFSNGYNQKTLTHLVIEEGIEYLNESYINCFNILNTITIPTSLRFGSNFSFKNLTTLTKLYYNGEHNEWYNTLSNCKSSLLTNITNVYFFDGEQYYEPTYVKYTNSIENIECFDKLEKIIVPTNITFNNDVTTFDGFIGQCDLYYLGSSSNWASLGNIKTIVESKFNVYCFQESEQTLSQFIASPTKLWHYDDNGEPTAWIQVGDTVANKTYTYTTTVVEVSDMYWSMLQQLKAQNLLEQYLDATLVSIFNASSTKQEFESNLAEFSKLAGSNMTISFTGSQMTIVKDSSITVNYFEIDGKIYANVGTSYAVYATIDGNTIYEGVSDEYISTKHIWTCQ